MAKEACWLKHKEKQLKKLRNLGWLSPALRSARSARFRRFLVLFVFPRPCPCLSKWNFSTGFSASSGGIQTLAFSKAFHKACACSRNSAGDCFCNRRIACAGALCAELGTSDLMSSLCCFCWRRLLVRRAREELLICIGFQSALRASHMQQHLGTKFLRDLHEDVAERGA